MHFVAGYITGWLKPRISGNGLPMGGHEQKLYIVIVPGRGEVDVKHMVQYIVSTSNPPSAFYERVVTSKMMRSQGKHHGAIGDKGVLILFTNAHAYSALERGAKLSHSARQQEYNKVMGCPNVTTHHTAWSKKQHYRSLKFTQQMLQEVQQPDQHTNAEVSSSKQHIYIMGSQLR